MVDSFLSVYPDKESHLLWESEPVPFYLSPAIVRSRADRYKIVPSSSKPGTSVLRVYSAVSCTFLPSPFFFIYHSSPSSVVCTFFFICFARSKMILYSDLKHQLCLVIVFCMVGFTACTIIYYHRVMLMIGDSSTELHVLHHIDSLHNISSHRAPPHYILSHHTTSHHTTQHGPMQTSQV